MSELARLRDMQPEAEISDDRSPLQRATELFLRRSGVEPEEFPRWYTRAAICVALGLLVSVQAALFGLLATLLSLYVWVFYALRMRAQRFSRGAEEQCSDLLFLIAQHSAAQRSAGYALLQAIDALPPGPMTPVLRKVAVLSAVSSDLADAVRAIPSQFYSRRLSRVCAMLAELIEHGTPDPQNLEAFARYCEPILRRSKEQSAKLAQVAVFGICLGSAATISLLFWADGATGVKLALLDAPWLYAGVLLLLMGFACMWRAETMEG